MNFFLSSRGSVRISLLIIALLAGNIIPLTPVLILWMNMATSATLSFVSRSSPESDEAMTVAWLDMALCFSSKTMSLEDVIG